MQIFVRGLHQLILIAAPEQRAAAAGIDYWPGTDACCIYLVGVYVSSVYLVRDRRQLRMSMLLFGFPGMICLVAM